MKRMIVIAFALSALLAVAMPTKEELAEAQSIVNELMADHIAAPWATANLKASSATSPRSALQNSRQSSPRRR